MKCAKLREQYYYAMYSTSITILPGTSCYYYIYTSKQLSAWCTTCMFHLLRHKHYYLV